MYQVNPLVVLTEGPSKALARQSNHLVNAAKKKAARKLAKQKAQDSFLDFVMGKKRSMSDNLAFSGKAFG